MKKTRKILAAILAMVMVFAMSLTASAATITVNDGQTNAGSTYAAYKLLDAECSTTDANAILYKLNEKYEDALRSVTGYTKGSDIVNYIGTLDSTGIREFADNVYAEIKTLDADYTTTSKQFTDVEPGYYMIVETANGDGTFSLVMLDTISTEDQELTITTKESVPELVKKVQERNDTDGTTTDWQDAADYDIGDSVPFQLTGTVSAQYANYKTYYYAFHDTLSEGFEFDAESVVVKVDDTVIAEGYEVITEDMTDGCSFEIRFNDLKEIEAVDADSKIVVEYSAKLTEDAKIAADGNPNVAKLEYCNDPYYAGTGSDGDGTDEDGSTSMTPEDKVTVFTYELDVNKVDKNGAALKGAGFTLYKLIMPDPDQLGDGQTAGKPVYEVVEEIVSTEESPISEFKFIGLDAGQYKLVETTIPEGYNKAEDLEFTVTASYDTDAADPQFTELTVEVDKDLLDLLGLSDNENPFSVEKGKGVISTNVLNLAGYVLPSTGGIGTVIFYIAGAAIMLGAVVLFVRSRRAGEKK